VRDRLPAALDENVPRAPGYFQENEQMLYFVQQKRGNRPYSRLIVVECATFQAIFLDLKPISSKLLRKIQQSPSFWAKDTAKLHFLQDLSPYVLG